VCQSLKSFSGAQRTAEPHDQSAHQVALLRPSIAAVSCQQLSRPDRGSLRHVQFHWFLRREAPFYRAHREVLARPLRRPALRHGSFTGRAELCTGRLGRVMQCESAVDYTDRIKELGPDRPKRLTSSRVARSPSWVALLCVWWWGDRSGVHVAERTAAGERRGSLGVNVGTGHNHEGDRRTSRKGCTGWAVRAQWQAGIRTSRTAWRGRSRLYIGLQRATARARKLAV